MIELNHVDVAEACTGQYPLPGRHLNVRLLRAERSKHRVRSSLPVLEGAVERQRPGQLILATPEALESRRVVRRLHLQTLKEARCVRRRPRQAKRPHREHNIPAGLHKRAREIPGDLRRAAARVEHQTHTQTPASPSHTPTPLVLDECEDSPADVPRPEWRLGLLAVSALVSSSLSVTDDAVDDSVGSKIAPPDRRRADRSPIKTAG